VTRRKVPFAAQSTPSIVDFIADPALLGPFFSGASWNRWRAVLKAAFALPMTKADRVLFAEVSGGRAPPTRRVRELICCIGRGGGKNSISAALASFIAVTGDFSRLRPGEKASILTLATDRRQAAIAWDYIRGNFEASPLLSAMLAGQPKDGKIELRNNAVVEVVTNNPRAPRGLTIACAIFDEAAHWYGQDYANPDVEVDNAVSPGLMRFSGSLKIIISSVHRRSGLLYEKYAAFYGKDDDDTLVVAGTSLDFNPSLDVAEIDRQLLLDPERAGAEFLSRWRDDLSSFIDRQLVEAAIDKGVTVRPPQTGVRYVAFADPSGGRNDSFCAAIGHRDGNLAVIDALYERKAPFDSDDVLDELCVLLKQYGVTEVYGDDYAADLTVAAFKRRGVRYVNLKLNDGEGKKGKLNRSEIYLNAVGLFTSGRARLLDSPRLIHQLVSLERRAARPSGHDTVDHPVNGHDDLANSTCGCLVALAGGGSTPTFTPDMLAKIQAGGFALGVGSMRQGQPGMPAWYRKLAG
jgi:hypothetical protein